MMTKRLNELDQRKQQEPKLADVVGKGTNSYGIIRLIAALLVIWTHSYRVVGGPTVSEPLSDLTGYSAGGHAVNVFFSLSGMMVAASLERSTNSFDFAVARILRILPALIVTNVIIVLFCGLFITTNSQEFWTFENIGGFLGRTLLAFQSSATLEGVFDENPWKNYVNVPIWTIKFEIACYFSILLLQITKIHENSRRGWSSLTVALILCASAAVIVYQADSTEFDFFGNLARFLFAFYIGVAAWSAREVIPLRIYWVIAVSFAAWIGILADSVLALPLVTIATAYFAFWAGSFKIGRLHEIADRNDLSYGLYISGFFIQQWLMYSFPEQGIFTNVLLSTILSAMFAFVSWRLIEAPSLSLRRSVSRWWTGNR